MKGRVAPFRLVPLAFLVLAAMVLFPSLSSCAEGQPAAGPASKARYVFLVIGDGMGHTTEVAASRFLYGRDDGLAWQDYPFAAWAATWDVTTYDSHAAAAKSPKWSTSAVSPLLGYDPARGGTAPCPEPGAIDDAAARAWFLGAATDSAAAATAMASGQKTDSGRLAVAATAAGGGELPTVAEEARARLGAAIGVVSTVPFDHATPAALLVHYGSRGSYADIAADIIGKARPEVVIGGGHPAFRAPLSTEYLSPAALDSLRADARWRLAERKNGADGAAGLRAAAAALGEGQGLFGLYGGADGALEAPRETGAFDQEGHPAFSRQPEEPSFAEAVLVAAELLARDPDGFLLVAEQGDIDWANHGKDLARMHGAVASMDEAVRAIGGFVDRPGDNINWDNTLVIVTADHSTGLVRLADGSVSYNSSGHANELVAVRAQGSGAAAAFGGLPGADYPGTAIMENTAIHEAILRFLGLR